MKGLYRRELEELLDARERWRRRTQRLLDRVEAGVVSEEEAERQRVSILQQFDAVARRLLQQAERDVARWRAVLDAPPGARTPDQRERAAARLGMATRFRDLVVDRRARISGEEKKTEF